MCQSLSRFENGARVFLLCLNSAFIFFLFYRVTRDIIHELAASGAVNSLRLPVGDYMYKSYGPYDGCFDGALEYIDQLLDWAYEIGLTVLIDVSFLYIADAIFYH